jgi:hypothetical protein
MAKMTKRQLKTIVKECLVEILSEGLASGGKISSSALRENSANRKKRKESIQQEEERLSQHRKKFEVRVDDTVSHVTSDPIMQSILADTAKTTLQEQMSHEGPNSSSTTLTSGDAAPTPSGINLDDIFSGPKQNWSELAFDDSKSS